MTDTKLMIVAGALYDFAGYLTTRPQSVKYGASELAGPMVDALKEWAAMRGLPLDDAAVQSWEEHITRAADQVNTDTVSVPKECEWWLSDEFEGDTWDGQCGAKWTFTEAGPDENDMHYCPSCGGKLIIRAAQEGKK